MSKKRTFSFRSESSPALFCAKLQEEAKEAHLPIEYSENAFKLRIDANHGGQVFYQAHISAAEHDSSLIEGELVAISWHTDENKSKLQKILGVIGYIVCGIILSPVILLTFLVFGFYELFFLLKNKGKRETPRDEKKLLDFMLNKLSCTQIAG